MSDNLMDVKRFILTNLKIMLDNLRFTFHNKKQMEEKFLLLEQRVKQAVDLIINLRKEIEPLKKENKYLNLKIERARKKLEELLKRLEIVVPRQDIVD